MTNEELYLKTVFCCMACDGDIADEEVALVQDLCAKDNLFGDIDVGRYINEWIKEVNNNGRAFLQSYIDEVASAKLDTAAQLVLIDLAIKTIEADNRIEYSEVKFFKKIRFRLTVSDEEILAKHPDKEDFLLPDNNVADEPTWNEDIKFDQIILSKIPEA